MMLGGPSAQEIILCRQVTRDRANYAYLPKCIFNGQMTEVPDGIHCSKHGHVLVRSP